MIFSKNKKEDQEFKEFVFKKIFSSKNHKKIIKKAARQSAEDQQRLSKRYQKEILK